MKPVVTLLLASVLFVAGCQSLPDQPSGTKNVSAIPESTSSGTVFLSAQHCLSEYVRDLAKVHYGPCLKIISVDGEPPQVSSDGFIELPVATSATIGTSCVYRHADGSPIPATMETTDFRITPQTFRKPGERWYLHAHKQARQIIGCEPTLSRSKSPTYKTD
ncbi:hypothetical protein [Marinobacter sp. 1_MG-2023]|uniref:hypothetical protein n=1 Tax=Marinobacter sp. 1_MG-2023 TaxID=3062627 RepID=UPI0026E3A2B4|nr:hypothetical protein [Marinobacter sp. 1_MG-2023]MDO6823083.1 hypothetical protein [Marinobacter sp. 1_MG-2023]